MATTRKLFLLAASVGFLGACLAFLAVSFSLYAAPNKCNLQTYTTEETFANNLQWRRWITGMATLEKTECVASVPGNWDWFGQGGQPLSEQCTPCYDYQGPCVDAGGGGLDSATCSTFRECLPTDYGGANGIAARYNWCMGNLSRLSTCVNHVDCNGQMTWGHWTDTAFNYLYANNGVTTCVYVDPLKFLEQCEARIQYADQRDAYGYVLPLTFGLCVLLWVVVIVHMLSAWRRSGKVAPLDGGSERFGSAVDHAQSVADALGGDLETRAKYASSAAKSIAKRFTPKQLRRSPDGAAEPGRLARLMASPWWSTAMFIRLEATELVSQYLAFASPPSNTRYILVPNLHGAIIVASGLLTPVLFLRGYEGALHNVNVLISLGYLAIGLPGLFAMFQEVEDASLRVEFTAVTGWQVFLKCVSVILPLVVVAQVLHAAFAKTLVGASAAGGRSHDQEGRELESVSPRPGATTTREAAAGETKPSAAPRSKRLLAVQWAYLAFSWAVALLALLAVLRVWDCGRFRTCQVPPCSIDASNLPFGIPASALPFETQDEYSNSQMKMRLTAIEQGVVWNWEQRTNLRYGIKLNQSSDGSYMLTLKLKKENGGQISRIVGEGGSSTQYNVANRVSGEQYGQCHASFHVQCQERVANHAFRDTLLPFEFVRFRDPKTDPIWKLVLADPAPACWTAAGEAFDPSVPESGWWYDIMAAGPSLLAGRDFDGTARPGLVMDGTCSPDTTANAANQPSGVTCLNLAYDVIFSPGYGFKPIAWSDWELDGTALQMPTDWSATNGKRDEAGNSELELEFTLAATEIENVLNNYQVVHDRVNCSRCTQVRSTPCYM